MIKDEFKEKECVFKSQEYLKITLSFFTFGKSLKIICNYVNEENSLIVKLKGYFSAVDLTLFCNEHFIHAKR